MPDTPSLPATVNGDQRANWDTVAGPKWIRHEAFMEASHTPIAALLLTAAQPAIGEAVLEIGCGTGTLLGRLAEAVGPRGSVQGVDISATMLDVARGRAPAGVRLMVADAQTVLFDRPYDLMVSRFGVMFFDDPAAAFAHLHAALRPGGRLCFVCWAGLAANLHWSSALHIITRHLGPSPPRHPDAPGPFAFADAARVRTLLERAGFTEVTLRTEHPDLVSPSLEAAIDIVMNVGPGGGLISERVPDAATRAAIRGDIAEVYRPHQRGAAVHLPGAVHLVTARA